MISGETIAFIGLGNMGGGMAANLARGGATVRAFDLAEAALGRAARHGVAPCGTVGEAVEGAAVVVTMLPSGRIVEDVLGSKVIGVAPAGALLIDCSTIDIATARRVARMAEEAGYDAVDAPVSGSMTAAEQGTLTVMVGGEAAAVARAEPILARMGRAVIHAGGNGAGQAAKMCNNMLLAATMIATCEAFVLAEKLGLDPQTFFDIAAQAPGQSSSMTSYGPLPGVGPASPADHGGFASALMLIDLGIAMEAAAEVAAHLPMAQRASEFYGAFNDAGNGGLDFSAIITAIRSGTAGL